MVDIVARLARAEADAVRAILQNGVDRASRSDAPRAGTDAYLVHAAVMPTE